MNPTPRAMREAWRAEIGDSLTAPNLSLSFRLSIFYQNFRDIADGFGIACLLRNAYTRGKIPLNETFP